MIPNPYVHRIMLPVSITFMMGVTVGVIWPGKLELGLTCAGAIAIGLISIIWRRGATVVWPLIFCAILGYISIQPWLGVKMPDRHVSQYAGQGVWTITGVVADAPRQKGNRLQFVLTATELGQKGKQLTVKGKVKVSARGNLPPLQCRDVVVLKGRLRTIRSFANPGGFDYARFMALQGILVRAYARKGSLRVIEPVTLKPWQSKWVELRHGLANGMDRALANGGSEASRLLKALIVGQRDQISFELRQMFNAAGVSHVLAISGLHIGMVAAATFGLVRWLFCWIPMMLTHGWTRKGAAVLSFGAVLFYALLAGMSPSTQRATIMVTVVLMGYWVGRRNDWLNALALAALLILIVYPPALLSISFQLSFSAVLAIVLGLRAMPIKPLPSRTVWWRRWSRRWLAFLGVSGLAILGTLPLVLYYFNQTSLVGLVTNMVVVPLVGLVVVPAGLLGVLVFALTPYLAKIFWHIAIVGIEMILWVVHWVDQLPWAAIRCVTPSVWEILLYYICIGVILGWRKLPSRGWLAVGLCVLWAADVGYWSYQRFWREDLRITAIDVGQGTANLLQLPGGYTVLVDGGGFSDNSVFDVGERVVAPLLWRSKIRSIDLVILSHPNSDHLNGLLYILNQFNVPEVWSNHEPAPTWGYRKWQRLIKSRNIKHLEFGSLQPIQVGDGVTLSILGPPPDYRQRLAMDSWRDLNNNSLVVQVKYGQVSVLLSGDISAPAEAELIRRHGHDGLASSVLMVPHHGSRYSSTNAFLEAVRPSEAIISSGWNNRYGFPHVDVLRRLEAVGVRTWCTSQCGAVKIVTDGHSYRVVPVRSANDKTKRDRQTLLK